jgi:hypothetical protein
MRIDSTLTHSYIYSTRMRDVEEISLSIDDLASSAPQLLAGMDPTIDGILKKSSVIEDSLPWTRTPGFIAQLPGDPKVHAKLFPNFEEDVRQLREAAEKRSPSIRSNFAKAISFKQPHIRVSLLPTW